jgi:alpha,alpha-trehalase
MLRREFLVSTVGAMLSDQRPSALQGVENLAETPATRTQWARLDSSIASGWQDYISVATEDSIRNDKDGALLFLPFPYVSPMAPGSVYRFMFGWDNDFVSRALIAQDQATQAKYHLMNYASMIDRFGYMPNANAQALATRSQTPLVADTAWRYFVATNDREFLDQIYSRLKRNYRDYWCAPHHQTPTGLATNWDSGDKELAPRLAAEAETGLDWTPIYGGDVRRCVPLITNCALVRYANRLSNIASALGQTQEAKGFADDADRRSTLIRHFCWSEQEACFLEYDYVAKQQLPYVSDCALWTLWAGVATRGQAKHLVEKLLPRLEQQFGISSTDRTYPVPEREEDYGPREQMTPDGMSWVGLGKKQPVGGPVPLQWMYPAGWAPSHMIAIEGFDAYGYVEVATRVAGKFLRLMLDQNAKTGHLWEKYNVVTGSVTVPNSRYGNLWMYGWTAAAVAILGRRLFQGKSLQTI